MKKRNLLLLLAVLLLIPVFSQGSQLQVKLNSEVTKEELAISEYVNNVDNSKGDSIHTNERGETTESDRQQENEIKDKETRAPAHVALMIIGLMVAVVVFLFNGA